MEISPSQAGSLSFSRTQLVQLRYLLVVPVPFYRTPDGRVWLDRLWHHDLMAHLDYLTDLTVLAPENQITKDPTASSSFPSDLVEVVPPEFSRLTFLRLVPVGGLKVYLFALPRAVLTTWRAVARADLVHSGVAGWPLPVGLIVNPVAWFQKKPSVIVIESAFWRLSGPGRPSLKERLRARLTEAFAQWTLHRAQLGIYTHAGYRDSLPVGPSGTGVVLPASWIKENDLLTLEAAARSWEEKPATVRFLLPSRLSKEKGISVFLEAARLMEATRQNFEIHVIGTGPLAAPIAELAAQAQNIRLRLLDPVAYGAPFMALLRDYHAVIVPTTGDEQPRILYDSFAQAVPVIASSTPGNLEVVRQNMNGKVFLAASATAFVAALAEAAAEPSKLRDMGLTALETAQLYTHTNMHTQRAAILAKLFGQDGALR